MEGVDSFHLLTRTDELDGLGNHSADTQSRTTAGITVELGQHHAVEIQTVVELLSRVHRILTRHGVNHEQGLIGIHRLFQGSDLVHHLLVNSQTTGGIDDDHVVPLGFGLADSVIGNLHHVLVPILAIDGNLHRGGHHLQLFDGSRTIDVAGHQ